MYIAKAYIIWVISLFLILFLAVKFIPNEERFLGGGLTNYQNNPYVYSWANFDGEHYLAIAQNGYGNGEQSFFPLYPILISLLNNNIYLTIVASNIFLILAMIGLYKLTKNKTVILLLLTFPTSFYFFGVYTESLFLCLTVWSFYFFYQKRYLLAGILGGFASATKIIGVILLPSFKKLNLYFLLIPLGLLSYMFYSYITWGDPLKFLHAITGFGEQRSDHIILLPQVFYRYFVKIIPSLTWTYFPVVFTTLLELLSGLGFLYIIFISFRKLKIEYWIFLTLGYLVPTFSGSFSSLPRYVLVLFPFYIFVAEKLKDSKLGLFVFTAISVILGIISFSMFARGYWLA